MEDAGDRPEGLRPSMMTWKSCENLRAGHCKWGDSCYYAHTQEESEVFAQWQKAKRAAQKGKEPLPPPDRYFRTQICSKWREGTCRNGAACTFAHGEEALRRPPPLPPSASAPGRWEPRRPPSSPRCEPEAEGEGQQQAAAQRPRPPLLCKFWAERGNCRFGDDCRYEHTPSERGSRMQEDYQPPHREQHGEQQGGGSFRRAASGGPGYTAGYPAGYAPEGKLFKTKLCANFSESGQCRYGDRCNFAHGEQELQPMPQFYRGGGGGGGGGWGYEEEAAGGEADFFDSWRGDGRRAPPGYGPRATYQQPPPPPAAPSAAAADGSRPRTSYNPLAAQRAQSPTSLTDSDFPPLPATAAAAPNPEPAAGSSVAARKDSPAVLRVRTSGGAASLSSGGPSTPSPTSPAVPGTGAISSSSPSNACSSGSDASEAAAPSVSGEPSQNALSSSAGSGSVNMDAVDTELAAAAAAAEAQGGADYYRSGSSLDGSGYHGGVSSGGVSSGGGSVMSASEYGDAQEEQQEQEQAGEAQEAAGSLAREAAEPETVAEHQVEQQLAPPAAAPAPQLPPPVEVTFNPCGNPPASAAGSTAAGLSRRSSVASDLPTMQAVAAMPTPPPPATAAVAVTAPAPPAKPAIILPDIGGLFSYRCPLTKAPFVDPVLAADGFTYERKAIHDWLFIKGNEVSPVTGDPMPTVLLVPNKVVRGMMAEMDHVLRCIANGVQPPLAPAPTGLAGI